MKSPWLLRFPPRPDARLRLVCLPGAGCSAAMYHPWSTEFPADVEVCAVQLPGRGGRLRETPVRRMEPLADALAEVLHAASDRPMVLFGHSLGALIAYEVAARLRQLPGNSLTGLIVAAHKAPHLGSAEVACHDLPEDELLGFLDRIGGTPPGVLARPEIRQLALPALRADFELDFSYTYRERPPLDIPLSAFGGTTDALVSGPELAAWERHTAQRFLNRRLTGGHFFLTGPEGADMRSLMRTELLAPARPDRPAHPAPRTGEDRVTHVR
ncbi:thioesterase II family protein [Streptomyces pinistramenti]|uniref:thioesterase II family protein n=1 Tax=Streptomyces pinistramenti TaxID=2884812 RepID=UPI001D077A42|nr:alpha/beta fold hydrolase [Streptomyces pinistramenti]MCB5906965.1 alpha/beta fold hydrolase [Streptomyces pinistramenti]